MERRRVLFVDDEENILQGLRRSLRPLRAEWDMEFALSGGEAMVELNRVSYDVVVSDMRMPGMSGAELLRWVSAEHPDTLRIILSGQADEEGVLRSVGPAHQFLSKPCNPELLIETIQRAFKLRDLLSNPELRRLVSKLGTLPSLPELYAELVDELQLEDPSTQRIGDLIGSDMAMSARVQQLVNPPFFGMPRAITSPAEATRLLGLSAVKSLVLAAGAIAAVTNDEVDVATLESLWQQSLEVSGGALRIVELERGTPDEQDAAVSAGLLHDIGALVLLTCLGDEYRDLVTAAAEHGQSPCDAELEVLGATHAQVGAYLLGTWGIPIPVVEAVAHHHDPSNAPSGGCCVLTAVHVAAAIVDEERGAVDGLDEHYLERVGVLDRLPLWRSVCEDPAKLSA